MKRPATIKRISSTTSSVPTNKSSNIITTTMNLSQSSKTMTTLTRLRQQQDLSLNDDESSTVQIANSNESKQEEHQPDLYTPLSYDEADENQLAEFFTTLDIDISFGGCNSVINNISQVSESTGRQSAKRRRLSNDGDSLSSSFSDESYNYDGTGLQRKQDQVAPIE